jgi:hypothetical protein
MTPRVPVAELRTTIDEPWTRMEPLRLGTVPAGRGTASAYVTVDSADGPLLRVDLYPEAEQFHAFSEALVWSRFLAIGWGHCLYLVRLGANEVSRLDLGTYFGYAYPEPEFLLVASAERLFRIGLAGGLEWRSDDLGIDGVIVDSITSELIEGQGEWDPPGGWRPFRVSVSSGKTR